MDGDLQPRDRRSLPADGEGGGYSTTIPVQAPQPVRPQADMPHRDRDEYRDRDGRQRRDRDDHPDDQKDDDQKDDDQKDDERKDESDGQEDDQATGAKDGGNDKSKKKMPGWKKALYFAIGLIVLVVLIVVSTLYYLHARHYEGTDDAFIDGHQSQVSAQVAAKVITLAIQDNQPVKAGDPILQLDPREYQVKLAQARAQRAQATAQLLQAQAGLLQQQAQIDQAEANVRIAQAELGQQQTDLARYRAIDPKAITRQQLDQSSAQTKSAAAKVDANRQAVESARAQLEAQKAQVAAAAANVQVADATIESAELQLGYTTVKAPDSGRITRRTVEIGNYVSPGQALLAIVPDAFWVTANYKETQLEDMRPGQPVRVRVDACPGIDFAAHVDSFQTGTGAAFSSLPAENATGNYVKVVQRVPVKVAFDQKPDLARCNLVLGMSVSPRVTVR
jgi:membrane fusion protein (multidrug efflux system)